jgi:NAD(P)-dependent dehydrogenase (short-subunit alcohol dehydrogenase family)
VVHLASLGFDVVAGVRRDEDVASVEALAPERITGVVLDVTDPRAPDAARDLAARGGLYGLVNNAGVTVQGPLETLTAEQLRAQLEVNLVGPVALTSALIPTLRESRGRVVNVSSIGGRMALPFVAPYHISKFGLEAFSDSLRMEVKPFGIEVSVIEPGSVKTEIWRKGEEEGRALIDALAPADRERYGRRLEGMLKTAQKTAARGVEPLAVAEAIAHALTAKRPQTRYLVGGDARLQATLKAVLPDRVMDAVVARLSRTR